MTTASCDPAVRERAQKHGCAAFFWKPVDGDALMAAVVSLTSSPSAYPQARMTTLRESGVARGTAATGEDPDGPATH